MALEGAKVVAADVNINHAQSTLKDLKGNFDLFLVNDS